jgi:hypothetical protein
MLLPPMTLEVASRPLNDDGVRVYKGYSINFFFFLSFLSIPRNSRQLFQKLIVL